MMRSSRLGTALLGIAVLFLAAPAAQAGHLERPDLLQVDDYFYDTDQPSGVDSAYAGLSMNGSIVTGSVAITVTSGFSSAGFSGSIQDFDKATKTSNLAWLINRKNTYMTAFTFDGDDDSTILENQLEDCSLRIKARDDDDDGSADSARWWLDCKSDALERIGLSEAAQMRFLEIFDNVDPNGVNAKALSYTGRGLE